MVSMATSILFLGLATVAGLWLATRAKSCEAGRRKRVRRAVHRPSQVLEDAYHLRS